MRSRSVSFFLLFIGAIIFSLAAVFSAGRAFAADCPAGSVPITAATRGAATAANIPISSNCWNPSDPNAGQAAGEAKQWLQRHATRGSNISCLNPEFAQKVKAFMEAVPGGPPTIISAYRPPGSQIALVASGASKAGPCESYHNYGLAVDFNNNSQIGWMRANSRQFGINIIGAWDPNHFQDARGRFGQCGACSNYTGNGMLPDPPSTQSSSLSDQIRQALGMQQQPPLPPQPPMSPQPTPSPQPSPSPQLSPSPQPNISSESPQPTPVSSIINTNNNTNTNKASSTATSTWDLIDAFLDPISDSIDIGKAVDIALNPDTSDVTSLDANRPTSTLLNATGTITMYQPPNTFTSSDLAKNPFASNATGQNTFVLQVLETMKRTLLLALEYLKPFGGRTPVQGYGE
ncbi:hypothetical protein A3C18_01735 [Candidatus Kaiserbacteria bacterium RIFCSPHIGHO2_02_FULL_54_11b]|uniref:Peptidase M15B domain-containing protein n=2 Tax=Candidatus Kaiseribacteriota TaxID=1752734 RepID=A0A1F6CS16_9BACT|nr:MAG: hypothetical protein A2704_00220 [Candidatus Kaiserbacteria bacterium RIFCSPHIGHO2_01_FULL_54_36b]OGG64972.1 MAG: hypothetical protein A3C18_01735 [Candidatus Kaiserbacteria bacterium RIFCSPHIGHO2_02_FULL_54_11b]